MEPTINTFKPSSIVLQCGADSLGCDRLGCFNLSIAAHGECVRFIKGFNLPMIVVGGGGYTIKNVSRCWTYETAVLLDSHQTLPNSLPHTAYDDFFAPDWKLHPDLSSGRNRVENLNTKKSLERIRIGILERLRFMHGAPSVALQEIPPGLAPWLRDEEENEDSHNNGTGYGAEGSTLDNGRSNSEWYDGDRDLEDGYGFPDVSSGRARGGSINVPTPITPGGSIVNQWGAGILPIGSERQKRQAAISATANLLTTSISENQREKPLSNSARDPERTAAIAASTANARNAKAGGKKRRKTGLEEKKVAVVNLGSTTGRVRGKTGGGEFRAKKIMEESEEMDTT